MILADANIWIIHLKQKDELMTSLLSNRQVVMHPFVIGELACGHLDDRDDALSELLSLPPVAVATDAEVLLLIEQQQLMGSGIGYIDAHLLTVANLKPLKLWTRDKALRNAANSLGLGYEDKPPLDS